MGHIINPDKEHQLLQRKLDRYVTGAPDSPTFMKILHLLFTPADAELARQIPFTVVSLPKLAQKLRMAEQDLAPRLEDLAARGLVFDLEVKGKRYYTLAPIIIGFFELTFMRVREDIPQKELAELFEQYMTENDNLSRSVFAGTTQIGRALVQEEALPEDDFTEILDWERATHILKTASQVSVSLCACRHKQSHLGKACSAPMETCLTLGNSAEILVRRGFARAIDHAEALDILAQAKSYGLMQTGDNVKRNLSYICNCCGCCCAMIKGIKQHNISNAIVSSNYLAQIDGATCKRCGKCVTACPINAIDLQPASPGHPQRPPAVVDQALCLGCGVCYTACAFQAISMTPRKKRVFTPDTIFEKFLAMALERGKLTDLLFDEPENLSFRVLASLMRVLEKSPPMRLAVAIEPLRSRFLKTLVAQTKKRMTTVSKKLS